MASSGTVALSVDFKYKPPRGREEALVAGVVRVKDAAVIEANDLELRTIKAINLTPFFITPTAGGTWVGGPLALYGSVNTPGSLMNAVTIKALYGSWTQVNVPAVGTGHLGTIVAIGTHKLSFFAVGA